MQMPNASLLNHYFEFRNNPRQTRWSGSWKLQSCAVSLVTAGFIALSPVSFARGGGGGGGGMGGGGGNGGGGGGHMSQGHWDPFWTPSYLRYGSAGYGSPYDSNYCYTPTQEQAATAQKRVKDYLASIQKGRRRAASHRYIAVETLRPTKKQLTDYMKKRAEAKSTGGGTQSSSPSADQLRCMMVFDTQSKQFVGAGCYVIASLPPAGTVGKFDTVSAEYVGTTAL